MAVPIPRTPVDWLRTAARYAQDSDDPHTQNGAVLVPRSANCYVAVSANRFPKGVGRTPDRLARPEKYRYIEHAERGAVYAAARIGTPTDGGTLYCPWFACADCARAIICSGVREVVGHVLPRSLTPDRWLDDIALAESMLTEAGVSMRWLAEPLGVKIMFDGEEIQL